VTSATHFQRISCMGKTEDKLNYLKKKLHKYVRSGRTRKMRRISSKYAKLNKLSDFLSEINRLNLPKQQSFLHKYALEGNEDMVCCLISLGACVSSLDSQNNSPLHLGLDYVLHTLDLFFFEDAIFDLIAQSPEWLLTHKNKYGETPNDMIEEVMKQIQKEHDVLTMQDELNTVDDACAHPFDEKGWNEKLMNEFFFEDQTHEDYAWEEHSDTFHYKESLDDWASRIYEEYQQKQQQSCKTNTQRKQPKSTTASEQTFPENFDPSKMNTTCSYLKRDLRKRVRILKQRQEYEKRCETVFKSKEGTEMCLSDIPFPMENLTSVADVNDALIADMFDLFTFGLSIDEKFKYLKVQQVRWHPDRFLQSCGNRILSTSKPVVMAITKLISQLVNSEIDRLREENS